MKNTCLFSAVFLLCIAGVVTAAPNEPRHALVIGNAAYKQSPLRNPVNDAKLIANSLETCGFKTALAVNCTLEEMETVVLDFGKTIRSGGAAFFFYSGHGLQVNGENYLQPVDARFNEEGQVPYQCMPVGMVLAAMEGAQTRYNFVVLDACRDNPFARSMTRGNKSRGLAQVDSVQGTLIAFATAPGKTAEDGSGSNSTYTASLASFLTHPGLTALDVFLKTQNHVSEALEGRQQPWISLSPIQDFYFSRRAGAASLDSEIEAFIDTYQRCDEARDLEGMMDLYADTVVYFGDGRVNKEHIRQDKVKYHGRWPELNVERLSPPAWRQDPETGIVTVAYDIHFSAKNPLEGKRSQGKARNTHQLKLIGDNWKRRCYNRTIRPIEKLLKSPFLNPPAVNKRCSLARLKPRHIQTAPLTPMLNFQSPLKEAYPAKPANS